MLPVSCQQVGFSHNLSTKPSRCSTVHVVLPTRSENYCILSRLCASLSLSLSPIFSVLSSLRLSLLDDQSSWDLSPCLGFLCLIPNGLNLYLCPKDPQFLLVSLFFRLSPTLCSFLWMCEWLALNLPLVRLCNLSFFLIFMVERRLCSSSPVCWHHLNTAPHAP